MRITKLESFTVAIPFRAPILSAFGVSYPARIRTFIRIFTDEGYVGIGETGPGALNYVNRDALLLRFEKHIAPAIIGESPYDFNWIRRKLFHTVDAVAIEIACWDIIAQKSGVPLYRLLGGQGYVEDVPVAGYCFFRSAARDGTGEVTQTNFVEHCLDVQKSSNFDVLKIKLGANRPEVEVSLVADLRAALNEQVAIRIDPNGSWSLSTALRMLKRLEPLDLEYIEEPVRTQGPADGTTATTMLRRLRSISKTPIAADHSYRVDLLAQIVRDDAADLVLADIFGSGGIEATMAFCRVAGTFGLGVALHSGTELCVGQAVKTHIQAALPDIINFAGDAIYPEYVDGVLIGGKLRIKDGKMKVPQSPGLGIELDENKLAEWELTAAVHSELDAFWDEVKARTHVDFPGADMLMQHY